MPQNTSMFEFNQKKHLIQTPKLLNKTAENNNNNI